MPDRRPDSASEQRLEALRREAERTGRVDAQGIRPQGAPFPQATAETGYYGLPLLKPPVWTWEVPLYFFVGGAAGAAAVLGVAAQVAGVDRRLVRDARWIAAAGAVVSGPLLVSDLGRPGRFLNMLRIFKLQSPMSVGAWALAAFSATSTAAVLTHSLEPRFDFPVRSVGNVAAALSAATGLVMATYTGVLLGATAIPVWSRNVAVLPVHFGGSAMASAVALLELRGHRHRALHALGAAAAAVETVTAGHETERSMMMRAAEIMSGPVPLLLRLVGRRSSRARRAAALSALIGSVLTRFAWVEAGKRSAESSGPS